MYVVARGRYDAYLRIVSGDNAIHAPKERLVVLPLYTHGLSRARSCNALSQVYAEGMENTYRYTHIIMYDTGRKNASCFVSTVKRLPALMKVIRVLLIVLIIVITQQGCILVLATWERQRLVPACDYYCYIPRGHHYKE